MPRTSIQEFYSGSKVLITGATGFLGIVLLEKLLRACSDISTIYLLVRSKKGVGVQERVDKICEDEFFERLRLEQPNFAKKLVGISGNCSDVGLGLSEQDRCLIENEVTIVFHGAATVNFNEQFQTAVFTNVRGTREVIDLCRSIKNLKFVTHVSTVYVYCHKLDLKEDFYECDFQPDNLITLAEEMPPASLEKVYDALFDKFPNKYALTKSISEEIVRQNGDLPVAVFRPGIIVSTYEEPLAGWINNLYGPQGVTTAAMVGLLHTMQCFPSLNTNIVPVDKCANALIAIPWEGREMFEKAMKTKEKEKQSPTPTIYNFDSDSYAPINWSTFQKYAYHHGIRSPSIKVMGPYFLLLTSNTYLYRLVILLGHYLPAYLVDCFLKLTGRKPILMKVYAKIEKLTTIVSFFTTNQLKFNSRNAGRLYENMSFEDRKVFNCDLKQIDWFKFFDTYYMGCRKYLLKDTLDTIPAARKKYRMLQVLFAFFYAVLLIVIWLTLRFVYNLLI